MVMMDTTANGLKAFEKNLFGQGRKGAKVSGRLKKRIRTVWKYRMPVGYSSSRFLTFFVAFASCNLQYVCSIAIRGRGSFARTAC